jgi:hypothetical protein
MPSVPNVMVLLDAGKSFEAFQADDAICRQRAGQQTGTTSNNAVNENPAVGAALGALAGAGLVAVIGAASGQAGPGAAIGACSGLLFGTALASRSGLLGRAGGPAALRQRLSAAHVCEGKPGPGYDARIISHLWGHSPASVSALCHSGAARFRNPAPASR